MTKFLHTIFTLVLGCLVGAVIVSTLNAKWIDSLYMRNHEVNSINARLLETNRLLREELSTLSGIMLIEAVEVVVQCADKFVESQIKSEMREWLSPIVGTELSVLEKNPGLLLGLIQDRTFTIGVKTYGIEIELVVISTLTTVWVRAVSI